MTRRQRDDFARVVYHNADTLTRTIRWRRFRRTGLPIAAGIAIVIACAVIIDLPSSQSVASEHSEASALLTEINNDITPCAFGISETATLYQDEREHSLSASERSKVATLLDDDASACSFTSGNINDLTDIEEPGTGIGKYLAQVVSLSVTWTTSDALGSIDDVVALSSNVNDKTAAHDLSVRARYLASDRDAALQTLATADRDLRGGLPALKMPKVRFST